MDIPPEFIDKGIYSNVKQIADVELAEEDEDSRDQWVSEWYSKLGGRRIVSFIIPKDNVVKDYELDSPDEQSSEEAQADATIERSETPETTEFEEMSEPDVISALEPSDDRAFQWQIVVCGHTLRFGKRGKSNYPQLFKRSSTKAYLLKERYVKSHSDIPPPTDAGFWERWVLFNKKTIEESFEDAKQRALAQLKK